MEVKKRSITFPRFIRDTLSLKLWKRVFGLLLILNALFLLICVFSLTIDKRYTYKFIDGLYTRAQFSSVFKWYPDVVISRLKSIFASVDHVYLDIKHKHIQTLDYERVNALAGDRDFNYVPARLTNDIGEHSKVKIRLKGDRSTHWDHFETSSYRIRVKGDRTMYGMKTFSFQKPRARNYIHEWIFLEMMRKEGIVTPRYKFVNLHVNGKNLGPYVIEEHYSKHLIEANHQKEGPILRIDENSPSYAKDFLVKQIVPYNKEKWMTPEKLPLTTKAIHLLEAFRQGDITVSQAFDVQKLATFFAIADVTGGQHGVATKSMRFYYNPVTSRLEPIPFDGHPNLGLAKGRFLSSDFGNTKRKRNWVSSIHGNWMHRIFNDPEKFDAVFMRHYIDALYRISDKKYLDDFFADTTPELTHNLAVIYTEIPLQDKSRRYGPAPFIYDSKYYYNRQQLIQQRLKKVKATAYLEEKENQIDIKIRNSSTALPIEFVSLQCGNNNLKSLSGQPIPLPETATNGTPILHKISVLKSGNFNIHECQKMYYRVLGEKGIRITEPSIIPFEDYLTIITDISRSEGNLDEHSFLKVDGNSILIEQGTYRLDKNLIIPAAFTLNAEAGTTLLLENSAMIYSKSPINFIGTEIAKISISSEDGTGQGITVINSTESKFEFVEISNMTSPKQNGWSLPGVLNFYESPVKILNSTIHNTTSEDAINIVRSSFSLSGMEIRLVKSDAIDIDFGEGEIINTRISQPGNDAIDVSGTRLLLNGIYIENAKDKGISAGELSIIDGENVEIRGAEIGVASKDGSIVTLSNIKITDSSISVAAYNKKPEFGSGTISLFNYIADEKEKRLIEHLSHFVIDGTREPSNSIEVEKKLYGKSSK